MKKGIYLSKYCFNCGKNVNVNLTKSNDIVKTENFLCNECFNILKLKQTKENRIMEAEEKKEFEEFKQLSTLQRNNQYGYNTDLRILFEQKELKEKEEKKEFEEFKQLSREQRDIRYGYDNKLRYLL